MSETLKQTTVEVDLQYYLSIFQILQQDIENIKRIRTLLGEPVDLSIDLAPVDYDDEDGEIWQTVIALAKLVKKYEIDKLLREHPLDIDTVIYITDYTDKMIPIAREFIIEVYEMI